jgi:hypothetical protein
VKNEIGDEDVEEWRGAQIEEMTKTRSFLVLTDPFLFAFITYSSMHEGVGSVLWDLIRASNNLQKIIETLEGPD